MRPEKTGVNLLRASVWTAMGTVAARSLGVVTALALSLILGASGYGQYSLLLSTATLCAGVGQMGLQSVITRDLARDGRTPKEEIASTSLYLMMGAAALVSMCVAFLAYSVPFLRPLLVAAGPSLWLLVPWSVALVVNNQVVASLVGIRRFGQSAALSALRGLVVATGLVAASLSNDLSVVLPAAAAAEAVAALLSGYVLGRNKLLRLHVNLPYVRQILRVGVGAGIASLSIQVVTWGAQTYLANQPDGFAQVGVFALGVRLGLVASILSNSLVTTLLPFLSAEGNTVSARKALLLPISLAALSSLMTSLLLPFISLYWPSEYLDHRGVLALMLLLSVFAAANTSVGSLAVARGRLRHWVVSDLLLSLSMALCAAALVPPYGASGLAIAQMAAYSLSVTYLAVMMRREELGV